MGIILEDYPDIIRWKSIINARKRVRTHRIVRKKNKRIAYFIWVSKYEISPIWVLRGNGQIVISIFSNKRRRIQIRRSITLIVTSAQITINGITRRINNYAVVRV